MSRSHWIPSCDTPTSSWIKRLHIGGGLSSETFEEARALDLLQHLVCIAWGDRAGAQRHILVEFDENPTHAEEQHRSEQRVLRQSDDGLDAPLDHFLHQHPKYLGLGGMAFGIVHDLRIGLPHFDLALHPQADHASLGFMRNIRRFHFEDHRVTDLPGRCQRGFEARRALFPDARHLPMGQEATRLMLRQGLPTQVVKVLQRLALPCRQGLAAARCRPSAPARASAES